MKKTLFIALAAMAIMLASCIGSGRPEDVVAKAAECLVKGDFAKMADYGCFKDDADRKDFIEEAKEHQKAYDAFDKDDKFKSFEIIDTDIDEEDGRAEVKVEFTFGDGRTRTDTYELHR